jgi:uncharacterized C2H2 Zn-finger protein
MTDMGLLKRLTETHESKRSIMMWDCPFCDGIFHSEKAAAKHIETKHGGRS